MKKYILLLSILLLCTVTILILPATKGSFTAYACRDEDCPGDPPPPPGNNGGPGQEELHAIADCKANQHPCTLAMQIAIVEAIYAHGGFTVTVTGPNSVHITCGNGASIDLTGPDDTPTPEPPTNTPIPPTPTTVPACNAPCSSAQYCQAAQDGCSACLPNGSGQTTCQKPPVCGAGCVSDPTVCQQNVTGCNTCRANTTSSGPAMTCQSPAACGANCTADPTMCNTVVNVQGCNKCLVDQTGNGTTKTCQTTPACGADCSKDASVCSLTTGCSQCVDFGNGSKKCSAPISCGSDCTGNAGICKQANGGCNVCFQNKCSQDLFNPGMCTCDGTDTNIQTTVQLNDQDVVITGYGKVSAVNNGWARVKDMTFSLLKMGSSTTMIAKSDPIPAVLSLTTSDKVQYKAIWTFKLPSNVQPGDKYQVTVATNCQRQQLASLELARKPATSMVLGINTTHMPLVTKIASMVKHLFGISDSTSVLGTQTVSQQLQIQSFSKVNVTKSCQSVNFDF